MRRFLRPGFVAAGLIGGMLVALGLIGSTGFSPPVASAQAPAATPANGAAKGVVAEIRQSGAGFVEAFNAGDSAAVAGWFGEEGELVDEEGAVYHGKADLTEAFKTFFAAFPNARLALTIESVRAVGPNLAIEEGVRTVTAGKDGEARARLRYVAVRNKTADGKWLIASLREFADDPAPAPADRLQSLAWLVGDWVNEGSDAAVKISYRWSEDKNYLLGDYEITSQGRMSGKSTQRIGWDPVAGRIRSWLFDSDGGFAEGQWTETEDGWIVKSHAVNPDATTGSATLIIARKSNDRFEMHGRHRVVGEAQEPDFEVTIVRKPPTPSKISTEKP